ncbi:hypothetical protein AAFF_G00240830 [Aldrovandia affinis]|uniref:Uncharacterized protein n=1 Tax=Aldrovandia affinis TaxID=143900 RepID=A0AAD7WTV8_9TELE|nr:hypothetical protein AAFF_G00240830 [Aldrovandia affinis]
MALSSVSMSSSSGPTLEFEDYSLYSSLTENELIELAIERSLAEANTSGDQAGLDKVPALQVRQNPVRQNPSIRRTIPPHQQNVAPPANPPQRELPCEKIENIEAHFVTGSGKRMIRWRRYDGSLQVAPEPTDEADPLFKAIWEGNVETVKELVKRSARSVTEPYRDGWIALHEAAHYGQKQCLGILLRAHPGTINKQSQKNEPPLPSREP